MRFILPVLLGAGELPGGLFRCHGRSPDAIGPQHQSNIEHCHCRSLIFRPRRAGGLAQKATAFPLCQKTTRSMRTMQSFVMKESRIPGMVAYVRKWGLYRKTRLYDSGRFLSKTPNYLIVWIVFVQETKSAY